MRILHSIEILNVSYLLSFAIPAIYYFRVQWLGHDNNIHSNVEDPKNSILCTWCYTSRI